MILCAIAILIFNDSFQTDPYSSTHFIYLSVTKPGEHFVVFKA